ncbi:MAG: hypothetical protein OXP66_11335 [Candidatus Tectomicrobia bacterium]|nr:hypothetical protein [Candidatus Tectomicrobia bacterium]
MDPQPPEESSALVRKVSDLEAQISGMRKELAEIVRLLAGKDRSEHLPKNEKHGIYYEIHKSSFISREQTDPMQNVEISGGQSLKLPDNRWLHRCGKCACTWLSASEDPGACVRHRPDKKGPRCGTTRWREIHDEYWANAAAMSALDVSYH